MKFNLFKTDMKDEGFLKWFANFKPISDDMVALLMAICIVGFTLCLLGATWALANAVFLISKG